jgi:RNA polymerase sigma factor (sigma-70 family)
MTPLFARQLSTERTFERMYRSHVQDVFRYSLMVLRNPDDAEEVAQTTFLKAYRAFQRGERPRSARHWLIAIAHNTCRTRLRDAKRRPQEVALEEGWFEATQSETDDEHVNPKELVRALGALTLNQRAALVMRELEGRSYAEIADVLQVSASAVETLLFRARRALREQLEGVLDCGAAELALSLDLDGRLARDQRAQLRAHLRECRDCERLARRQRAQRSALRSLGPLPLPASLTSWGGATATGTGIAAKVAVVVVAGAAAVGTTHEAAEAVGEAVQHDRRPAVLVVETAAPVAMPAAAREARLQRVGAVRMKVSSRSRSRVLAEPEAHHTAPSGPASLPAAAAPPAAEPEPEPAVA